MLIKNLIYLVLANALNFVAGQENIDNDDFLDQNVDLSDYLKKNLNISSEEYKSKNKLYYLFYEIDYNKDTYLDMHEIRASIHHRQMERADKDESLRDQVWDLDKLNDWVNKILDRDDKNKDGFISLPEYFKSHEQVPKKE
ncbi:hypothetical protein CONCODRAFT_8922 [Conidiobolus coronatus NRRL 28638]|uniref:EF-hand domain-containing protein n=1 Tax=Conidiobolus coronatus (strain ATCC 28846 / CBS 209.66 / NRRL 28638) TaxID=796925 RepID=A0A137P1K9_CONC2|nr:hypothetical protein CONCODRAFT_8922 [Conidiobolus coronatus NRRL 28638]|eukprot:KXN68764.1 hypothetical protein CONCODRAFT_8922 [Conidiobolus coronatus NRRL 28638]